MYDNVGGKIKGLAKVLFVVSVIADLIVGIALMATNKNLIGWGLFLMIVAPFFAGVPFLLLYGLGQLVENSDIIAKEYRRKDKKNDQAAAKINKKKIKEMMENPDIDEDEYIDMICPKCKAELSFTKGQLQDGEELSCPMCDAHISI